jgi:hypothetical protein
MISAVSGVLVRLYQPHTKEMHMTQPLFLRLALGVATLACVAWLPAVAGAATDEISEILDFKGTATDIGVQRAPGQVGGIEYRIEGKFQTDVPLDLGKSTVTFHRFLDEEVESCLPPPSSTCGNGEMVLTTDNADLVCSEDSPAGCDATLDPLVASSSSKRTEGKYETPARFRPQMRVQIKSKDGEYKFNVRLDRGTSPQVLLPGGPTDEHLLPADRQFPHLCKLDPEDKRLKTDIRTAFTISDEDGNAVVLDFVRAWECSQPGRYHLRSR